MLSVANVTLASRGRGDGPFVLLVDDHEPTLKCLQAVLEAAGYQCVAIPCPSYALEFCGAARPSLVVTDLTMPHLCGDALADRIHQRYPGLPVVLVTGEPLDGTTMSSAARTFAGVFPKPLQVEPFLELMRQLMPPRGQTAAR